MINGYTYIYIHVIPLYIYIVGGSFLLFSLGVCFVCCECLYVSVCTYVCIEQLLGVGFFFFVVAIWGGWLGG